MTNSLSVYIGIGVITSFGLGALTVLILDLGRVLRETLADRAQRQPAPARIWAPAPTSWPTPQDDEDDEEEEEEEQIDYHALGEMTVSTVRNIQRAVLTKLVANAPSTYLKTLNPAVLSAIKERF